MNFGNEYTIETLGKIFFTVPEDPKPVKAMSVYYDEEKGVTVVIWEDGTKTIVRTCEDDGFDKERGFLQAYFEKSQGGTKTQANKTLKTAVKNSESKQSKLAKKAEREAEKEAKGIAETVIEVTIPVQEL